MKSSLLLALMATLLIAADKPKDAAAEDRQKLQGTWQVLEESHGDNDTSDEGKHCQLIFDGDKFIIKKDGKVIIEGTFEINAGKSPREIDMKVLKDEEDQRTGQTALGIYKIDGDKLTWCSCEPGRGGRPAEFAAKGTNFLLIVMERAKK
ncbi:MAG: hypothetical protein JWN24_2074 [Phycisphaerales bacterium]|nr:hypothetical protein [Phycisphaerales bacterium]